MVTSASCDFDDKKVIDNLEVSHENLDLTPIQKFYGGATVFITGATGFLGQILVEKLLRSCPTVSTLYLLIRSKKGKNMEERLDEMFSGVVFRRLKKECPNFRQKVVAVGGDCSLSDLGLNLQDKSLVMDETNIVFHLAATVRFDENIKTAVAINIKCPHDLIRLARNMKKLKSFIHVSTIYGNCPRDYIEEKVYPPAIDGKQLILLTDALPEKLLDDITPRLLGDYPNTYAFTKQIAEDIVKQECENMPVGIFRPAIVVSTYKEPIEAWINNVYGPTGVCAATSVGLIRTMHGNPSTIANLVPVDMCVNSMIASAWQVGKKFQKAIEEQRQFEIPVYNYESGNDQPINWKSFHDQGEVYGMNYPPTKALWYYFFVFCKWYPLYVVLRFLLHTIPGYLADAALVCARKEPKMIKAYKKLHKFTGVVSYFALKTWTLQTDNVRNLINQMSAKDREIFFSDIKLLSWTEFQKQYFKGVRIYLLKDPLDNLEASKKRWNRLYYAHQFVKFLLVLVVLQILYLGKFVIGML